MEEWLQHLADKPWLAVILAVGLGVCVGTCFSVCLWAKRRRGRNPEEPAGVPSARTSEDTPWEAVQEAVSVLLAMQDGFARLRKHALGPRGLSCSDLVAFRCPLCLANAVAAVFVCTFAASGICIYSAVMVQRGLAVMRHNSRGDPERIALDECMRDFEGLPANSADYQGHRRTCVEQISLEPSFAKLPMVRKVVDDGLCDAWLLCGPGDPGKCGDHKGHGGVITECYQLIERAQLERDHIRRGKLLVQVDERCTGASAWTGWEREVDLVYCMRKHEGTGVCANSVRAGCVESCCPAAVNQGGQRGSPAIPVSVGPLRPQVYACRRSPTDGLFCQHLDFNASTIEPCTDVSCPSFTWCRGVADIPGECLSEACVAYQRAVGAAAVVLALACVGLLADAAYLAMMIWARSGPVLKSFANAVGTFSKLLVCMVLVATGLPDFVRGAAQRPCWSTHAVAVVADAVPFLPVLEASTAGGAACSFWLGFLAVRCGTRLVGVPRASWAAASRRK